LTIHITGNIEMLENLIKGFRQPGPHPETLLLVKVRITRREKNDNV